MSLYSYITQYYWPFSLMYFTFKVVFNSFAVQLYNIAQYHKSALQRQFLHHTSALCSVKDHHLMFNQLAHRSWNRLERSWPQPIRWLLLPPFQNHLWLRFYRYLGVPLDGLLDWDVHVMASSCLQQRLHRLRAFGVEPEACFCLIRLLESLLLFNFIWILIRIG